MESKTIAFANISQRAIFSYKRTLVGFSGIPGGVEHEIGEQAQHDLHAFFTALYTRLYEEPELFGLPTGPDAAIEENEPNEKDKKQWVKRLVEKPRGMVAAGLDFLMMAGIQGRLDGGGLVVDGGSALVKQSKVSKAFLHGMDCVGLRLALVKDQGTLVNGMYPTMMPALQALARSCAGYENDRVGKLMFAACDFRALNGYLPQAEDLIRVFDGEDYERAAKLHGYFTGKNYKTEIGIGGPFAWNVKYQGDRKVKASPLFQIDYEERYARSQRLQIKCASTGRIAGLLLKQSQRLQEDFSRRVFNCNGDACGWCRNKKTLGPTLLEIAGETRTVCWYSNSDIKVFDEHTIELVQEYEQMHAELAPE